MLWSLWSVRAFSRSNDSPEREINVYRLESLVQYSFLNSLLKHARILRYSDRKRREAWECVVRYLPQHIQPLLPTQRINQLGRPPDQLAITDFFPVLTSPHRYLLLLAFALCYAHLSRL